MKFVVVNEAGTTDVPAAIVKKEVLIEVSMLDSQTCMFYLKRK